MPEENQPAERYVPVWGILLLFLGIIFLLQSFEILSWSIWGTLWRFWPMILVLTGISILMRRFNVWLVSLLMVILLLASLGIALWQNQANSPAVNNSPQALAPFTSITYETANGIRHLSL